MYLIEVEADNVDEIVKKLNELKPKRIKHGDKEAMLSMYFHNNDALGRSLAAMLMVNYNISVERAREMLHDPEVIKHIIACLRERI